MTATRGGVARRDGTRSRRRAQASHAVPARVGAGEVAVAAREVSVRLGGKQILRRASVEVRAGELVALVGPNGAGKSTLLAVLAGDLAVAEGVVELDGGPLGELHPTELARRRSVLLQEVAVAFPFRVGEVVRMGRAPWVGTPAEDDDDWVVPAALEATDTVHLADRTFPTLSGGERARVALARVLAQQTQVLMLDEPTAALDLHHQELVLDTARRQADAGDAVVVVLHDLGLAAAHADRVVMVAGGRIVADGPPAEVLTSERLRDVYHHDVEVLRHPDTGALLVLPRRASGRPSPAAGTAGLASTRPRHLG
jgi:iron complex transport system ATP-binding protein